MMPVTPIMAAIYYGEEETAKQLLEAGAECDFSKPLFRMFGATGETLRLVEIYMNIWFFGCATSSLCMAGNDLLIACGDSRLASFSMMLGLCVNVLLDPLFIFGWRIIPAMGIAGAAAP